MSGKQKHNYKLRQNEDTTWSILVSKQDGETYYHGSYSLKQAAVRFGDSHKIPNRFPQVVQVEQSDDPFGDDTLKIASDGIDRSTLNLLELTGINVEDPNEVAEFLGVTVSQLKKVKHPDKDRNIEVFLPYI